MIINLSYKNCYLQAGMLNNKCLINKNITDNDAYCMTEAGSYTAHAFLKVQTKTAANVKHAIQKINKKTNVKNKIN